MERLLTKLVQRGLPVFSKRAVSRARVSAENTRRDECVLSCWREACAVGRWRHPVSPGKAAREGTDAPQSHGETNLGDGPVGGSQERGGPLQAPGQQIRVRRLAEGSPELATEVGTRQARGMRQVVHVERFEIAAVGCVLGAKQVAGRRDESHASSIAAVASYTTLAPRATRQAWPCRHRRASHRHS